MAIKYCVDGKFSIGKMAEIGGVEKTELMMLESDFLNWVDYKLFVSEDEYAQNI